MAHTRMLLKCLHSITDLYNIRVSSKESSTLINRDKVKSVIGHLARNVAGLHKSDSMSSENNTKKKGAEERSTGIEKNTIKIVCKYNH